MAGPGGRCGRWSSWCRRFSESRLLTSGSGSWFGFQVGLGIAAAVVAGVQGVPEVGSGGREVVLDPVAGVDDDHVLGGPAAARRAARFAFFGWLHVVTCRVWPVRHGARAVRCLVTVRLPCRRPRAGRRWEVPGGRGRAAAWRRPRWR